MGFADRRFSIGVHRGGLDRAEARLAPRPRDPLRHLSKPRASRNHWPPKGNPSKVNMTPHPPDPQWHLYDSQALQESVDSYREAPDPLWQLCELQACRNRWIPIGMPSKVKATPHNFKHSDEGWDESIGELAQLLLAAKGGAERLRWHSCR